MRKLTQVILEKTCEFTRHANGCWLLNDSPFRRLWWWSLSADVKERIIRGDILPRESEPLDDDEYPLV